MFRRSRNKVVDEALIEVYLRPDGYYLIEKARTTIGLWTGSGQLATKLAVGSDPETLGSTLRQIAAQRAEVVRQPAQDEWREHRSRTLGPLMKQAGVRSWRAFESEATLTSVEREGSQFCVTPMVRAKGRSDSWESDLDREVKLVKPDALALGAVVRAFADAE